MADTAESVDVPHSMSLEAVLDRLGTDPETGLDLLEAAALTVMPLSSVLGLTHLPGHGWALAVTLGLLPLAITQTARHVRQRQPGREARV